MHTRRSPAADFQKQEEPLPEAAEVPAPGEEVFETTATLLGYQSLGFDGNDLGNVHDMVVDIGTGYIAYVVLDVAQDDQSGRRLVPIPYPYFIPDAEDQTLRIGFSDISLIDDAPGYAPDQTGYRWGRLRNRRPRFSRYT